MNYQNTKREMNPKDLTMNYLYLQINAMRKHINQQDRQIKLLKAKMTQYEKI